MSKVKATSLKPGILIEYKENICRVVKTEHVKPGKGPAYVQAVLKSLNSGSKLEERINASSQLEQIHLDLSDAQYLYTQNDSHHFMNMETYETISIPKEDLVEQDKFLQEGLVIQIEYHKGKAINIILPQHMTFEIAEAEAAVKKQNATNSFKPAILTNDLKIQVPPHVKKGDKVVIDTQNCSYVKTIK